MSGLVAYLPIVTTIVAAAFAPVVFRRWLRRKPAPHLLWWAVGIAVYGVGTLLEAYTTLFGWSAPAFRAWYVAGALLGGAPLAQGTVYLMLSRRTADRMAVALTLVLVPAASAVIFSPVVAPGPESIRLSGEALGWQWVRAFSPFVNAYAVIFLVGGAVVSAWQYRSDPDLRHRFIGNCFIAVGAVLPAVGGASARMGRTEILYVTELVGLVLIWIGYVYNVRPPGDAGPGAGRRSAGETTSGESTSPSSSPA